MSPIRANHFLKRGCEHKISLLKKHILHLGLITYRTTISQPQDQASKHKQRRGEFRDHVIV